MDSPQNNKKMSKKYETTKLVKRLKRALDSKEIIGYCKGYIDENKELVKCDRLRFENEWYSSNLYLPIKHYDRLSHTSCPNCAIKFQEVWKGKNIEKILKR